jgi:hypothetical protein
MIQTIMEPPRHTGTDPDGCQGITIMTDPHGPRQGGRSGRGRRRGRGCHPHTGTDQPKKRRYTKGITETYIHGV